MSTGTAELNSKMLNFAQIAGEFGGMAKKYAEEGLAAATEARPLVEKDADAAIQTSLIADHERDEFAKQASTHVGALKLIGNLIRHIGETTKAATQKQAIAMGQASGENGGRTKKASYDSTESPFVGRRAGLGEKRASDIALFRGLGLDPENPTGKAS